MDIVCWYKGSFGTIPRYVAVRRRRPARNLTHNTIAYHLIPYNTSHYIPCLIHDINNMSSSKKQDRKEDNISSNIPETYTQLQRQQEQTITKALDESKDNIKKTTNEARREIPRYTDVISDYQENTVQAIREVADSYIESQKDIIVNSYQLWSNWMISPIQIAEDYSNAVSNIADNAISTTRLANNAISANLQAFNASVQTAKENAKELSKISGNTMVSTI
jgi:hypothetical protein